MFADSLLETSWDQRSRRGWITFTSFGVQCIVIGLLLMIPLLTTVGLPSSRILQPPTSFGAIPPPARPIEHVRRTEAPDSNPTRNVPIAPTVIPTHIAVINDPVLPPRVDYNTGSSGVQGPIGDPRGVWGTADVGTAEITPPPKPAPRGHPLQISSMLAGSLIHRVQPQYPPLARSVRVQGSVVLAAVIGKEGAIENLRLISGHPMLVPAAIEAVRQWRYRPYILNGEAVEVETQITVNFMLSGN